MPSQLRAKLHDALMTAVAGPEHSAQIERIHATRGPRWYTEADPIQIVGSDAAMYVGGMAALLLQSLHPFPMSAVADFSDYREDPFGRLARTATFLAETTFATVSDAEAAIERVKRVHLAVRGTTPGGLPYRADDPHLLTWVHCAEVWCFLRSHTVYGARRLTRAQADLYVRQVGRTATALGAEAVPASVAELDQMLTDFRPELEPIPATYEVVDFLLRRPPLPWFVRPGYCLLGRAAVALLPRWTRPLLGLPDHPFVDRTLARWAGHIGTAGIRWIQRSRTLPVTPPWPDPAEEES